VRCLHRREYLAVAERDEIDIVPINSVSERGDRQGSSAT
jgi:hypothetical protein